MFQELIDMFVGTFPGEPLDVPSLEADGSIEIIPYMISNRLNTKTHLATNPCFTPAAGKVLRYLLSKSDWFYMGET